jgi:glutamyl endopeptidase
MPDSDPFSSTFELGDLEIGAMCTSKSNVNAFSSFGTPDAQRESVLMTRAPNWYGTDRGRLIMQKRSHFVGTALVLASFVTASTFAPFVGTAHAASGGKHRQSEAARLREDLQAGPLSRDDARAQLDSSYLSVPSIQAPELDVEIPAARTAEAAEVTYDLESATESAASSTATVPTGAAEVATPGNLGSYANVDMSAFQKGSGQSSIIVGNDDRERVPDTTAFPWRTVCKLIVTFSNGQKFAGTGTMVGRKHVLTAGHTIYSHANGGWPTMVEVIPGLDGSYMPFGKVYGTKFRSFLYWVDSKDPNYDIALVSLNVEVGDTTGWLGMGKSNKLVGLDVTLSGYPMDLESGDGQYFGGGTVASSNSALVTYGIDADMAQTGAAIQRTAKGQLYASAVHIGSSNGMNRGVRLNEFRLSFLKSWVKEGN